MVCHKLTLSTTDAKRRKAGLLSSVCSAYKSKNLYSEHVKGSDCCLSVMSVSKSRTMCYLLIKSQKHYLLVHCVLYMFLFYTGKHLSSLADAEGL